ncbi:MAG: response regulator, partial [Microcoleus sp. SIO2G3]|nr:response regulator [Microcoleus sp. SIO2G3]
MATLPRSFLKEHPITVLLIDDQPLIGEAVRRMLVTEEDIIFHYCSDPIQAVQQATEIAPTVILQDLVMPEIDGLLLLRFFRANAATREIPMIVLSAKEEANLKASAFKMRSFGRPVEGRGSHGSGEVADRGTNDVVDDSQ